MGHREAGSPAGARSDAAPAPIDALIVVAREDELDAVLAEAGGDAAWQERADHVHVCTLTNEAGQPLAVAAVWAGAPHAIAAASRAASLRAELRPTCLATCGTCAGRYGDVALGDVIVADRVYSFDHGKLIASRAGAAADFLHDITTYNLERSWHTSAAAFRRDPGWAKRWAPARPPMKETQIRWLLRALDAHERGGGPDPRQLPEHGEVFRMEVPGSTDWPDRIRELREQAWLAPDPGALKLTELGRLQVEEDRLLHPRGAPPEPPLQIRIGAIGTGDAELEDPDLFDRLRRVVRTTLGVDQGASAIGYVGDPLPERAIVVKAVSHHADRARDDRFREFACRASAAWLFAFLRRHLAPRAPEPRAAPNLRSLFPDEELHRVGALQRLVERVLARRHTGARMIWRRGPDAAPAPLRTFLEVHAPGGGYGETYPVAVVEGNVGRPVLDGFVEHIVDRYRDDIPYLEALLIHTGSVSADADAQAPQRRVHLESLLELRGYLDFRPYVREQTRLLALDPPAPLEPRRIAYRIGPREHEHGDALEELDTWLGREGPQRVLLLGELRSGKTSLMRRLALRLGERRNVTVPVFIELRDLEKSRNLDALLGQHFPQHGMKRFDHQAFREMLVEGRIVLLFDGFDQLAERVTARAAARHLETVLQAAIGDAKVVITSRTEHFLDEQQGLQDLGERVIRRGFRVARLLP